MNKTNLRFFTITELLVVVAVLAILFTLLTPSLRKALQLAQTTSCQSNLKQISAAFQMYPEDYDGWFAKGGNMVWAYELRDYLGLEFPEIARDYRNFNAKGTVYECSSFLFDEDIAPPVYAGYAFNTIHMGNTREVQRVRSDTIAKPEETLVIGDGMNYVENNRRFHILYTPSYIPWHYENGYGDFVYTRHGVGLNLIWTDGHTSFEDWYELKLGRGADVNYFYRVNKL